MSRKALLLIDIQNGFCPGGALAVPDGDKIVPVANALMERGRYNLIIASQDWHPANHGSFASQHPEGKPFEMGELNGKPQMMWPDHCVQGTKGAEFHHDLKMDLVNFVQQKGTDKNIDSYSAFRDNDQASKTGLAEHLLAAGITELHICGLATDYCVKFSALDAKAMLPGIKIVFIEDASRGINPENIAAAKTEMIVAGITICQSSDILNHRPSPAIKPKMKP